ncbi:unnamed protein product [Cuscuta campestris]|uniref:DUF7895 domain-containing protein n=1 Tax=Cuscuta campestris TaxID=132261 RepID=A0A484N5J0_9ASTE|nr:unnamed protein product [Cuscuta campestris]
MELRLNAHSSHFVFCTSTRESKFSDSYSFNKSIGFHYDKKSHSHAWKELKIASALPETVATFAVAATVVGTAATLLARRTKASNDVEVPTNRCEACGGSGVCSECKGEGFIMKKLSEESAEKARMTAKNDATRYTAGLPKKWSYCKKCNASRLCSSCSGSGQHERSIAVRAKFLSNTLDE